MSTNIFTPRAIWQSTFSDKVWLSILLMLVAIFVLDEAQYIKSIKFIADALIWMLPIILLAAAAAAYSKASGFDQQIRRVFSKSPARAIVLASLFGALSPFCSCGVIALVAGMLRAGVPLAPVMAFWISSPIMDPEMFVLTSAILGIPFAIAKTLSAFFMGLLAGTIVSGISHYGYLKKPLKEERASSCSSGSLVSDPVWKIWQDPSRKNIFKQETMSTFFLLFKWLTLAFLLESLMLAYIPASWISEWLAVEAWWAIPMVALLGAPLYLNGYAAIPLASGLMEQGMLPGAALAFLIGGGVTSIPAAMSVFAIVRKSVFFLYLILGLAGAITAGLVYQVFV